MVIPGESQEKIPMLCKQSQQLLKAAWCCHCPIPTASKEKLGTRGPRALEQDRGKGPTSNPKDKALHPPLANTPSPDFLSKMALKP